MDPWFVFAIQSITLRFLNIQNQAPCLNSEELNSHGTKIDAHKNEYDED